MPKPKGMTVPDFLAATATAAHLLAKYQWCLRDERDSDICPECLGMKPETWDEQNKSIKVVFLRGHTKECKIHCWLMRYC